MMYIYNWRLFMQGLVTGRERGEIRRKANDALDIMSDIVAVSRMQQCDIPKTIIEIYPRKISFLLDISLLIQIRNLRNELSWLETSPIVAVSLAGNLSRGIKIVQEENISEFYADTFFSYRIFSKHFRKIRKMPIV